MKYSEIRKKYQPQFDLDSIPIDVYSYALSPLFTKIFLRLKLLPNDITILMIVAGIIGAALFSIPNLIVKIIGVVFIHLWYIFDCSDGEVARINKVFSKYGKEIDYIAHTVNHPFYIISFMLTSFEFGYDSILMIVLYLMLEGIDSYFRMSYSLSYLETIKKLSPKTAGGEVNKGIKHMLVFLTCFFTQFPNFALIYPIVMLVDMKIALIYLIIEVLVGESIYLHGLYKWLRRIRRR